MRRLNKVDECILFYFLLRKWTNVFKKKKVDECILF